MTHLKNSQLTSTHLVVESLHVFDVQRLQAVAGRGDEVQARVHPGRSKRERERESRHTYNLSPNSKDCQI